MMSKTHGRRTAWLVAALLITAPACGADEDPDRADSGTVPTETPSASTEATTDPSTPPSEEPTPPDAATEQLELLGSYSLMDEEYGTMVTVTVDDTSRTIVTNSLPDHATGEFPNAGNPNAISAQDLTWTYPVEPVFTGDATFVMIPGVAVNGVKFEPGTAEVVTCGSGETYPVEALQDTYDLGLDFNNAHVQPNGEYHYHGISDMLVDAYAVDDDLVLVGFAADGHLIHYSKSGAYRSGYALSTTPRVGTDCLGTRPLGATTVAVDGTAPDGIFSSDWVWSEANGDLDACNGTTIDGIYTYIVTETFPFISRCLNGDASGSRTTPGGPPAGGEEAGPTGEAPDLSEAAAALGVTTDALQAALGPPPPDLEAAAATLGITVEDLQAVLPGAP